jgi:hypothetical protein
MNLTLLQELIKKYRGLLLVFGTIILAILMYSIWNNVITNQPNPVFGKIPTSFIPSTISAEVKFSVSLDFPFHREKLAPVYKIKKRSYSDYEAVALAAKLGFTGSGKKETGSYKTNLLVWHGKDKELEINLTLGSIFMRDKLAAKSLEGSAVTNAKQAIGRARGFLKDSTLDRQDLVIDEREAKLLISGPYEAISTRDETKANVFEVRFFRRLGGYNVSTIGSTPGTSVKIQIGKNGKVLFLYYQYTEVEGSGGARYPLKDLKDFSQAVAKKKIKVPNFSADKEDYIPNPEIIMLGSTKIVLYDDGFSDFIQPIFLVSSIAAQGKASASVQAYLPAIKESYLGPELKR